MKVLWRKQPRGRPNMGNLAETAVLRLIGVRPGSHFSSRKNGDFRPSAGQSVNGDRKNIPFGV